MRRLKITHWLSGIVSIPVMQAMSSCPFHNILNLRQLHTCYGMIDVFVCRW
jgi:hypothetical protein